MSLFSVFTRGRRCLIALARTHEALSISQSHLGVPTLCRSQPKASAPRMPLRPVLALAIAAILKQEIQQIRQANQRDLDSAIGEPVRQNQMIAVNHTAA